MNYIKIRASTDLPLVLVPVWAGIELIFFIVASVGLWFGSVLKTVSIIQLCFCYC